MNVNINSEVSKLRLPALLREFLQQQAITNPQYKKPRPPQSPTEWLKPAWLVWGVLSVIVFQLTVIISLGDRLSNWYVVGLSLLMIGVGGVGGWWWLKSVNQQVKRKRLKKNYLPQDSYQYAYRQYDEAKKLVTRQQHRKLRQLLSGKLPKLITQSTGRLEEKKLKRILTKTFPFLEVKHRVKFLRKGEWIEIDWVIISERTQVFIGVFFEDNEQDYYLKLLEDTSVRERLLEENWVVIEINSAETLIQILYHLIDKIQLL